MMKRSRGRRSGPGQPQGGTTRAQKAAGGVPEDKGAGGRRGGGGGGGKTVTRAAERELQQHSEWEQRLKGLQLPAACSFVLGLVER